jgi:hypothetical protein
MLGELWHHFHLFRLRLRSRLNPWVRWRQNRFCGRTGLRVNIGCGPTRMEALNTISHGWWHPKYIYDDPTLARCFLDAGFQKVEIQSYRNSALPELAVDTPARAVNSIYVERLRPQVSTDP